MEKELKNPDIRTLKDLKGVLYDQEWYQTVENFDAYYMYRGVKEKNGLRYDITAIPFKMFGQEYPKTKGHYHPDDYGELYIVLDGQAIYLLQDKKLSDIVVIKTNPGEIAIIPPGYGHITINPGPKDLKMANWVNPNFNSLYEPILKKGGAAYFYTKDGWTKNKNYGKIPKIRYEEPEKKFPQNLSFLK